MLDTPEGRSNPPARPGPGPQGQGAREAAQSRLVAGLLRAEAYPPGLCAADARIEHLETHISHLFLVGERVYKIKKPVDLGFLDFSTLEQRRACCDEEVRLNRRLAPELYLGVVPITGTPDRPRVAGSGPAIEYAVQMRRFDQAAQLDRCVLTPALVDRLAVRLADFHAQIPQAPPDSPFGTPQAVLEPMLENFSQVRGRLDPASGPDLDRLESWTRGQWEALIPIIGQRRAEGRVRECHGDLHRGNIALVNGEPLFFDALEFNPSLRWIDTASELAFLLMDLQETGEAALAGRLLNHYLALGGDYGALQVLDLYQTYRAMVRAKVLAIRLGQSDLPPAERAGDRQDCTRYLGLAETFTRIRARRPRLVIACGLSGSGKSRFGQRLHGALPIIQVRSDAERKRLFGLCPEARSKPEESARIYAPEATELTYQRLQALAGMVLGCGYDCLVDATFLSRDRRGRFRDLAEQRGAGFALVMLTAPMEVLRQRVERRLAEGRDASEAGLAVLERQSRTREPLSRAEEEAALVIDSTDPPPLAEILEHLARLTGVPLGQ